MSHPSCNGLKLNLSSSLDLLVVRLSWPSQSNVRWIFGVSVDLKSLMTCCSSFRFCSEDLRGRGNTFNTVHQHDHGSFALCKTGTQKVRYLFVCVGFLHTPASIMRSECRYKHESPCLPNNRMTAWPFTDTALLVSRRAMVWPSAVIAVGIHVLPKLFACCESLQRQVKWKLCSYRTLC